MAKKKVTGRKKVNIIILCLIGLILCTNFFYTYMEKILSIRPDEPTEYDYVAHFIDVGQGDAIFIKFKSGKTMLVDSGTISYKNRFITYVDKFLLNKTKTIDYVVLTHPDTDHSGNMNYIIDNYKIGTFYRPACLSYSESNDGIENEIYDDIINKLGTKNINTIINKAGLSLVIDDTILQWLAPLDDDYLDTNLYSPVITIDNGKKKLMLTSDISASVEYNLISEYDTSILDVDILKIAHHGSKDSTTSDFLDITTPNMAIISVGDNTYSQPANEVLHRILQYDTSNNKDLFSHTFSTINSGNIIIAVNNDNIKVDFIRSILDYSFYGYWLYELLSVIILLLIIFMPYTITAFKNLKYDISNAKYSSKYQKNKFNK